MGCSYPMCMAQRSTRATLTTAARYIDLPDEKTSDAPAHKRFIALHCKDVVDDDEEVAWQRGRNMALGAR